MKESGEFQVILTLLDGSDDLPTRTLKLTPEHPISIGRSSKAPVKQLLPKHDNAYINNPVISRNHARLVSTLVSEPSYYIVRLEDEGSMHGTFINEYKIPKKEARTIATGDKIRFGANVTRGHELYKAPEFRFEIEKIDGPASTSCQAVPLPVGESLPREVETTFTGGYYVPDSDSSPAPSCIDDDYGSDVDDDGEDSHSSAPAVEVASPQKPSVPEVIEVSVKKLCKPIEIVDEAPEVIVLDDALSEVSEFLEVDYDVDQNVEDDDDIDVNAEEEEEQEEQEEEESEVYGYDEPSDNDEEDAESLIDNAPDSQALREDPAERNNEPSLPEVYKFLADLLTPRAQDASCDEDNFSNESIASETKPEDPVQDFASIKAAEQGAPVRRLEIEALLNDNSAAPKSADHARQEVVEHLMSRHPCDTQAEPEMSFQPPKPQRIFPFERTLAETPTVCPALPFGYKFPLPPPGYPNLLGVQSNPYALNGPPMVPTERREQAVESWCGTSDPENLAYTPWSDQTASRMQGAKPTACTMLGGSRKRSFNVFEEDLEAESSSHGLREWVSDCSGPCMAGQNTVVEEFEHTHNDQHHMPLPRESEVISHPAQGISTTNPVDADVPSSTSPVPQETKLQDTIAQQPPRKRARLQDAAKTAGTVLASALAGGVATFYALGLAPESFFI